MDYFFFTDRRIVFLHGFQKKTQKVPARELAVARTRTRIPGTGRNEVVTYASITIKHRKSTLR